MNVFGYTALEGYFDRPTGVGKHIDQMFHGLGKTSGISLTVLTAQGQLEKAATNNPLADLPKAVLPYRRRVADWRWLLTGRPWVDPWVQGADWVYVPYESNIAVRHCRKAVTVHSLYYFDPDSPDYRTRSGLKARLRLGHMYKKVMRESDLLLTVSEFVRSQMIQWYGVNESKVVVVGNGVEAEYYAAGLTPRRAPANGRPYVICVSGLNELDGASYVIPVAKELLKQDSDIEVLVAGHQHESRFLEPAKSLSNIRLLGYVEKRELAGLFRDSVALLFLNRYESFGIGAAEGMAARTPVIGTNFTAVPEIVGGAGLIADVRKPAEIARQIVELARSQSLRESYIERGVRRAALFNWDSCVRRLHDALRSARA